MVLPRGFSDGVPGRLADPRALPVPPGYEACRDAADLFFRWESAWGDQPMLGTEPLAISIFNRGYDVSEVQISIRAVDTGGALMDTYEKTIGVLKRGATTTVELHSYELPRPVGRVEVALIGAEFDSNRD